MPGENLITPENDTDIELDFADVEEFQKNHEKKRKKSSRRNDGETTKREKGRRKRSSKSTQRIREESQSRTDGGETGRRRRGKAEHEVKQDEGNEGKWEQTRAKTAKSKKNIKNEEKKLEVEMNGEAQGRSEKGKKKLECAKNEGEKRNGDKHKEIDKACKKKKKHKEIVEISSEPETSEEDEEEEEEAINDGELRPELLSPEELEKLKEAVDEKKKLIQSLRGKPWSMKKKLITLRDSQQFVEKYEGALGKGKGRKLYAYKVMMTKKWMKFQRDFENFKTACIPWEMKIKEIESKFDLEWSIFIIFFINQSFYRYIYSFYRTCFFFFCFFKQALVGKPYGSIPRKTVPRAEEASAMDFAVLWDFGGYAQYSVLFYGYYNNQRAIGWFKFRMPLSYFLVGVGTVAYSYMVVIRTMARNANESGIGDDNSFNFSWKMFTSWDYLIGNPETADNKFASITTSFKEAILEEQESRKDDTIHLTRFLRVLANFLVLCCLAGSGYLIYFVVRRSQKFALEGLENHTWWERNEVNGVRKSLLQLVVVSFNLPDLKYGQSHFFAKQRWLLPGLPKGNIWHMCNKRVIIIIIIIFMTFIFFIQQEFVRLIISDTMTTYITLLIGDFLRAVLVRFLNHCWCWDLEAGFPSYSEFDVSGNVLGLIFNQGMIWMGAFYAPCLPALNLLRLHVSMYLQCWAVMCCNVPQERVFKASGSNNFYMAMLLVILFLSTLPAIYTIVTIPPSFDCGPFSGKNRMFDVIQETLESDFPAWFSKVFSYASNPGLVLPFILLMILAIYYLQSTSKSYKEANVELKKKLQMQNEENKKKNKQAALKAQMDLEEAKKSASEAMEPQRNNNASVQRQEANDEENHNRSRKMHHGCNPSARADDREPHLPVRGPGPRTYHNGNHGNPRYLPGYHQQNEPSRMYRVPSMQRH
ncbi:PREDICTED: transmembrane channel-like protein 1 [Cyprinodon variegatus]|uniref:transmembrane channel-like protein 1 n=1 Tax=Cyprinodon variegatus TaxID=28743 RepID=UPI0007428F40|nr:PREDICTED: transmembrane channel-like protein 1 [Cyprinodon variegatus]